MTIVLTRPDTTGRHRLGRPGLIPVSALITVVRRGLLRSWLQPGRHRAPAPGRTRRFTARIPATVG